VAASLFFIYWLVKIKDRRVRLCLSFILSGTLGNMIDRVFRGGVIDFLSFRFGTYAFPVFNVADSLLVVGVILLIIALFFTDSKKLLQEGQHETD
jgi:signal peptidase II